MLYIGIDWSEQDYQVCILNRHGGLVSQLTLKPSPTSFAQLEAERAKLGTPASECAIGIETAHNLIVDFLLEHD